MCIRDRPKAALVYIEDLFEKNVSDDWDEFYEEAKKNKREVWQRKREQKQ
jgi:Mg2+/Co2+ transporter CorC